MGKILLKGGTVLSVDPDIGDRTTGDVLIEDDKIAAVEASIDADAEVVDCTGKIVIPGFVDTHRHTWEAAIRNCAPNATLDDYFVEILDTFAPLYRPEDVYASNLAGSLECLNAGITTLVDWSHINNTPEHAGRRDPGAEGDRDPGAVRVRQRQHLAGEVLVLQRRGDPRRRRTPGALDARPRRRRADHDGRSPPAARASPRTRWCRPSGSSPASSASRSPCTSAWAGWPAGSAWSSSSTGSGCSGPDTTYVHCCYFSDHEWQRVADTGGTISIAAQVETQMGHGWPPVNKARKFGLRPSLSIDVVTTVPGDMFTQIRAAFGAERARVNAVCWDLDIPIPEDMLTAEDMLKMATLDGAHVAGRRGPDRLAHPGQAGRRRGHRRARRSTSAPIHDPAAAVTLCADVSNVEHVLVAGSFVKRDFKLVGDVARAMSLVEDSRDHLVAAAAEAAARSRSWRRRDHSPPRPAGGRPRLVAARRAARRVDRPRAVVGRRRDARRRCTPASA